MPDSSPSTPDPELLARLAKLGVKLGAEDLPRPEPPARERSKADAASAGSTASALDVARRAGARPRPGETSDASPAVLPIEVAVPGRLHESQLGRCYLTTARRTLDEDHGGEALGAALSACTDSLAGLATDPALAGMDLSRTAFLDTETSGLGGGASTYAFLIGIGRYQGSTFQVRQFFMRDPSEEAAQLEAVEDWLAGCDGLVTFNGRSFDMPLLSTRCVMHRRRPFLSGAPHLDLLPAARRLWRLRLDSCTLTGLERDILGFERQDDVPGWMVPYRYFRYQQDGDARPLVGVFHHNLLDILSMASLLPRMARMYAAPEESVEHGEDWFSLARAYERAGEPGRAMDACEAALAQGLGSSEAERAWEHFGLVAKRAGRWSRAVEAWEGRVASGDLARLYPYEELAKYWEHRAPRRDLDRALELSREARRKVEEGELRPRRGRRPALEQLDHRIARLERRIGRGG